MAFLDSHWSNMVQKVLGVLVFVLLVFVLLQQEGLGAAHLHMQINAVQQRPRDFAAISADLLRSAITQAALVSQLATGTGVQYLFTIYPYID